MNTVTFIGNLCKDLELREAGASVVTELYVAINKKVKKNEEYVDKTIFVQVNVWGKQGENCVKYLKKGSKVGISGELDFDSWEKDGQKRNKLFVTANMFGGVEFLTPKGEQPVQDTVQAPIQQAAAVADAGDAPF